MTTYGADLPSYQRSRERHPISGVVNVLDTNRGLNLGSLANIHEEGLMIIGPDVVRVDHLYQVELQLPCQINGRDRIPLGIDCLWVRLSENARHYWSGFQVIDASDEARADILGLIRQLGQ